jgi:hypothetical protein
MKHAMLDIETLGTAPGCIVLSVGAARFDPAAGETSDHFYETINFKDSVLKGLWCDPNTYNWWQKQSKEAREAAFKGEKSVEEVVKLFSSWVRDAAVEHWWAQGSDFDFPIWEGVLKSVKSHAPWKFWQKRDTRTLYAVAGLQSDSFSREGTYHNALDDTLHQIRCVHDCYRHLGLAKSSTPVDELDDL